MPEDDYYLRVRIPNYLRHQLQKSATLNNRSMTGEILMRLQASLDRESVAAVDDGLESLNLRLSSLEDLFQRHITTAKEPFPAPNTFRIAGE